MINPATADALARIERVASDLREAFVTGGVPRDPSLASNRNVWRANDPLSVAAPKDAYFVTGSAAGPRFTRDGSFVLVNGELRARDGAPVLGAAAGGSKLAPIRIDQVDAALGRASDVRIEADGSVVYARAAIDPRSGERRMERVVAGRVALARFPAGTLPQRVDETHVAAPASVKAHLGLPGDGTFGALACRSRDGGGLDFATGLMRLQEAYLQLDAVGAAGKAVGGVEKAALDLVK